MMRIEFDATQVEQPSAEVAAIIAKLVPQEREEPEHRQFPRHCVTLAVSAVPVDEAHRPTDASFVALTRNISQGGISLIHSSPVAAKLLAIELPMPGSEPLQVVVRLDRCRRIGEFYELAGPFVTKLD
ncbi:MAG: hypothetical protein ACC645_01940 [Pirellulales bacterium]